MPDLSKAEVERRLALDPEGFIPPMEAGERIALQTAQSLYARNAELEERVREAEGALAYWRAAKVEAYKRLCHDRCMHGKGLCDFEAICDADLATAHIAALAAYRSLAPAVLERGEADGHL